MKFIDFYTSYPDDLRRVARECDTSIAYLSHIAYGHRQASHKLAKRIEAATGGQVTKEELRPDIFGESAA